MKVKKMSARKKKGKGGLLKSWEEAADKEYLRASHRLKEIMRKERKRKKKLRAERMVEAKKTASG